MRRVPLELMEWGSGIMNRHIHILTYIRHFFLGGLLAALVLGLFSRPVAAEEFSPDVPHPAVARIMSVETNGASFGSGTLVYKQGKHALLITNDHVIRDSEEEILVSFPNGFRSSAKVIASDPTWDLAALLVWSPAIDPVVITNTAPQPGDHLTIAGYGAGRYRAVSGVCSQYVSPGLSEPHEMVELKAVARQGDSGGPIFNQKGELAGVLFGAGWRTTAGSYSGRVKKFLDPVVGRMQKATVEKQATVNRKELQTDSANVAAVTQPKATITGLGLNEVQTELAPEPSKTLEAIESPAAIVEPEQNIELVPDEFTQQVSPPIPQTLQAETGEGEEDLIDKTVVEVPADELEAKLIDESVLQAQQAQQGQVPESVDNQLNVTSQEDAKPIEEAVAVDAENVDRNDMINETDSIQLSGTDSSDIQSDSQSDGQGLEELDSDSKIDVSPEAGSEGESIIGWTDLAGDTLLQQIRTVLAGIGILAIVVQLARR